jgi:hypothetical protein
MGRSQDEQFSLQAPVDLPSTVPAMRRRGRTCRREACGSARAALAKVDSIRAASDAIMVGVPHTAPSRGHPIVAPNGHTLNVGSLGVSHCHPREPRGSYHVPLVQSLLALFGRT